MEIHVIRVHDCSLSDRMESEDTQCSIDKEDKHKESENIHKGFERESDSLHQCLKPLLLPYQPYYPRHPKHPQHPHQLRPPPQELHRRRQLSQPNVKQ